jgi:hypothetical protein
MTLNSVEIKFAGVSSRSSIHSERTDEFYVEGIMKHSNSRLETSAIYMHEISWLCNLIWPLSYKNEII